MQVAAGRDLLSEIQQGSRTWWPMQMPNMGFLPSSALTVSTTYGAAAGSPCTAAVVQLLQSLSLAAMKYKRPSGDRAAALTRPAAEALRATARFVGCQWEAQS